MAITSLILPACILLILLALCHPIKSLRLIIKIFVLVMSVVIILFVIALVIAKVFDGGMWLFGF